MIDDLPPDQDERGRRPRPGGPGRRAAVGNTGPFRLSHRQLVAPNLPSDHNTLKVGVWVEAKIVTNRQLEIDRIPILDERTPIKNELCHLYLADGSIRQARTNDYGVVRFDDLPISLSRTGSTEDVVKPGLVLPEILEEWVGDSNQSSPKPPGDFGKNAGARDDYRQRDGCVHFVPVMTPEFEVCINNLTQEQKYQHIRQAYEDHHAVYNPARPHQEPTPGNHNRWEWGRGAQCNEHVNFFLAYWYNFNAQFTYQAARTVMATIMSYDSSTAASPTHPNHRGYREFMEPLHGFSRRGAWPLRDPAHGHPTGANYNSHYIFLDYIRIDNRFFDRATYQQTAEGNALIAALADFNVYSVGNIKDAAQQTQAIHLLQANGHPTANAHTARDIMWDLDERVAADYRLIHQLEGLVNWDHHGGILLKRGANLFTFSADGQPPGGQIIKEKIFDGHDMGRWFFHLAISKLKPLRKGGFSPEDVRDNVGRISIDEPPRFIDWS
jgi:hypothetical protein